VPERDAVAVERLVRAGAIVFGKTNTPLLASDWQSFNPIFGVTRNPWRPDRTPGGSSGGSAAAVAAGFSAFELGSDLGGSIRIPAHWCGVYGHKPTHGLIPLRGHIPGPPGTLSEPDLAVAGPIARDAEDLDLVLGVLAGPLPERARAWHLKLPEPRAAGLEEFRIAAWLDSPEFPLDAEVARLLGEAIEAMRRGGARVDEGARPNVALPEILEVYLRLVWPVIVAGLPRESFERLVREAEALSPEADDWGARLARFGTERHREWLSANERRERLRAAMEEFFADYDVLILPVSSVPAIPHDPTEPQLSRRICVNGEERHYFELFAWIALASATFLPATVAPIGRTREGLPVGIQIVGPYLEDRTPIAFAKALAKTIGGFEPPPGAREPNQGP
jgi:amidase